jgi:hypothetical protein
MKIRRKEIKNDKKNVYFFLLEEKYYILYGGYIV